MINKKNNIKSMIELLIANIDELDSEFITYKTGSMKLLLLNTLEYMENKEEECEELKDKKQYLINTYCHFKNEIKKYKKAVHKYKVVLQDKIKRLHLSRREFLEEINSVPVKITCKGEILKNALNNFNNTIQVINNEDRYKQALDRIEKNIKDYCKNMCMAETKETCESCQNTEILNIINKAKEDK